MKINSFECGLCKPEKRIKMNRKTFRKHLEEEHRIVRNKFNIKNDKGKRTKQNWVIIKCNKEIKNIKKNGNS